MKIQAALIKSRKDIMEVIAELDCIESLCIESLCMHAQNSENEETLELARSILALIDCGLEC